MCRSALLFSKKDYVLGDSLRNICRTERINLIYTLTFPEVLHHLIEARPEIIFFDSECVNFRFDLYSDFVKARYFEIPKIIIFSLEPEKIIYKDENIFVVNKRNYHEKVLNILSKIEEKKSNKLDEESLEKFKEDTINLLLELGITTKYLGYEYIKELVIDIIKDKRMLKSFNTKLYPKLAIKYNTQINNIERNIRNAISIANKRCKNKELYNEISGTDNSEEIPSNKQFITWLVEKVS